jgi:hypothetical protein
MRKGFIASIGATVSLFGFLILIYPAALRAETQQSHI